MNGQPLGITSRWRAYLLAAVTVAAIVTMLCLPAIPQDPAYHAFADARTVAGVANFWNVISNAAFLFVGIYALTRVGQAPAGFQRLTYLIFSVGVIGVAFGSSYYHLEPSIYSLVWDRLPMTLAFMAFFSAVIAERVSSRLGAAILWPALLVGIASVVYWYWTEARGAGDLRAYGLVQFLPMLLMPLILLIFPGNRRSAGWFWIAFVFYAMAKVTEHFDSEIFQAVGFMSGHSIKHVLGAIGALAIVFAMLAMQPGRVDREVTARG